MTFCGSCGRRAGTGPFCTHCGARVTGADRPNTPEPTGGPDGRQDPDVTAVRLPPVPPLPPGSVPPAARYPLYADEPASGAAPGAPASPAPAPAPAGPPAGPDPRGARHARSRSALPWVGALAVLATVAVIGTLLLLTGGPDDPSPAGGADPASEAGTAPTGGAGEGGAGEGGAGEGGAGEEPSGPGRLASLALVEVPATAAPSTDSAGNRVSFHARRMLDDDPRTCWRMAGDGTGQVVTFRFDEPVEVTSVGLVNGYAKTDPPHDWYTGNRRILVVSWLFDDGTEVRQDLRQRRALQRVDVEPVRTRQVQLRILEVTAPGRGPSGRDFTAISEVSFGGSAG